MIPQKDVCFVVSRGRLPFSCLHNVGGSESLECFFLSSSLQESISLTAVGVTIGPEDWMSRCTHFGCYMDCFLSNSKLSQ